MIRQIAIIGTGTMGRGIAYLSAVAGYETIIYDVDSAALDAARASIESTLRKGVEKGKVAEAIAGEAIERVQLASELEPAVRTADLIIEAVPEIPISRKISSPRRISSAVRRRFSRRTLHRSRLQSSQAPWSAAIDLSVCTFSIRLTR